MKTYYRLDESGRVLQSVILEDDGYKSLSGLAVDDPPASLLRPRWDGKKWVESASNAERSQALADHRRACSTQLQAEAEAVRAGLYPMGPHGLAVREQKLREARSLLQGGPKEEPVILAAEAAAAGLDVKALASTVLERHAAWCKAMASVEAVLRKYADRLNKEKERATLTKVLEAGKAALWALVYGGVSSATAEVVAEEPVVATEVSTPKETSAAELAAAAAEIAIKQPTSTSEAVVKEEMVRAAADTTSKASGS